LDYSGWARSGRDGRVHPVTLGVDPAGLGSADWAACWQGGMPAVPTGGCVYGVALNHVDELAALGAALAEPPYKAPPKAPILYVKPANTWSGPFADIVVPDGIDTVEVSASVALVFGRDTTRIRACTAWQHVEGLTLVADLSVPSPSFYRPPVRFKCLDGFCAIGPWVAQPHAALQSGNVTLEVRVDGSLAQSLSLRGLVRDAANLIEDISAFMTFRAGDVLMLGSGPGRPIVRPGQRVSVSCAGLGRLENRLIRVDASGSPAL
jgi:5-oxopent-3-ene-1,2,5-tricarboxylate decarboxylase/2-hydroxyhepta-2,4-diene-1,7-dioate isomerase